MSRTSTTFPWPSPPPGSLLPRARESNLRSATEVVAWFVAHWAPGAELEGTPLGAILSRAAQILAGESIVVDAGKDTDAGAHQALALRCLDWSIRALHGGAGVVEIVHRSFITKCLLGADSVESAFQMPQGIGTLFVAARLVQAGGGKLSIMGDSTRSAGHDLRWAPLTGGVALIERKDRAWEVGAEEPISKRARYVVGQVRAAGPAFPLVDEAARVLSVGFPGYVEPSQADDVRLELDIALRRGLGAEPPVALTPDALIVESLGTKLTPEDGSEHTFFTHMLDLGHDRQAWLEVAPAFARAFTLQGPVDHPDPWPILGPDGPA